MNSANTITTILKPARADMGSHYSYPDSAMPRLFLPREQGFAKAGLHLLLTLRRRTKLRLQWLAATLSSTHPLWFEETELIQKIREIIGDSSLRIVVLRGTPGPFTKDVILFMDRAARPRAIAKVGFTAAAAERLNNEAEWLGRMSRAGLKRYTPELICKFSSGTTYVLVETVVGTGFSGAKFSAQHIEFLTNFHEAFRNSSSYLQSTIRHTMWRRYDAMRTQLSAQWRERGEKALSLLDDALQGETIPTVAAHRDFAPWNIRAGATRIWVHDWEYAEAGYFPTYDLFHFFLIPGVVRSYQKEWNPKAIIEWVQQCLTKVNGTSEKNSCIDYQLLAYLLDLCLFYLESNDGKDANDRVVQHYGSIIDRFKLWRIQ
jgi:hypothetical protein